MKKISRLMNAEGGHFFTALPAFSAPDFVYEGLMKFRPAHDLSAELSFHQFVFLIGSVAYTVSYVAIHCAPPIFFVFKRKSLVTATSKKIDSEQVVKVWPGKYQAVMKDLKAL
jgi:hypothetical protein